MDCNREEALRAKQMAEKKMENKDFSGALKIATKAQQLYPELENISQMILVCEVHCSAEKKSFGSDKDWYGILKVETTAEDLAIKKQYRKLALVLHPDKNKFSGSTDAFKLIGEAQRVLLDRDKRMMHDSKRRAFGNISTTPSWIPKQPNRQSNVAHQQHPWNQRGFPQPHSVNQNNFTGGHSAAFQFSQRAQTGNRSTFWTVCPFCSVRYQFYRDDVLNKVIHCQSCKKSFTAYELNVQGAAQSHHVPVFPQQNKVPSKSTEGTQKSNFTSKPVFVKKEKERSKAQGNVSRKRKKRVEESSSESSDSESSSESEEEEEEEAEEHSESSDNESSTGLENKFVPKNVNGKNPVNEEFFGEQPRRSSRTKRNVSYKENLNENDDDATNSNQAKKDPPVEVEDTFWKAEVTKVVKETEKDNKEESHNEPNLDDKSSDIEEEKEPEVYECPDPEFTDFEKERKEESFSAGQIWAVYDNEDAMPRFYAYIRKVISSPEFKLHITWLKAIPGNTDEKEWLNKELPVSCGKFKRGKNDTAEDLPMFSHLVTWEDAKKGMLNIFPRKGETWALFRNWSIKWTVNACRIYEYEFVEILSDYSDDRGVRVSYLEKVKGFTCLFNAKEDGGFLIPASEKYRFAHMVPSCRMSGVEREGVPKGSYELDPASLPASAFEQVTL